MRKNKEVIEPVLLPEDIPEDFDIHTIDADIEDRVFWIINDVDDTLYDFVDLILQWNKEDKDIPVDERKPIRLFICSSGGSVEVGKTLYEAIRISKTPVYGIAIGMCASSAAMIYLACHKRFATRNSTFLFHRGQCVGLSGTLQEMISFLEQYKGDVEWMKSIFVERTKFSKNVISKHFDLGDWYLNVDKALKGGVIDDIVNDIDTII